MVALPWPLKWHNLGRPWWQYLSPLRWRYLGRRNGAIVTVHSQTSPSGTIQAVHVAQARAPHAWQDPGRPRGKIPAVHSEFARNFTRPWSNSEAARISRACVSSPRGNRGKIPPPIKFRHVAPSPPRGIPRGAPGGVPRGTHCHASQG